MLERHLDRDFMDARNAAVLHKLDSRTAVVLLMVCPWAFGQHLFARGHEPPAPMPVFISIDIEHHCRFPFESDETRGFGNAVLFTPLGDAKGFSQLNNRYLGNSRATGIARCEITNAQHPGSEIRRKNLKRRDDTSDRFLRGVAGKRHRRHRATGQTAKRCGIAGNENGMAIALPSWRNATACLCPALGGMYHVNVPSICR